MKMRKQPPQIAPVLCSIVALAGRHSATQLNGHLISLGGREIYKFDHLHKTKDLAASSVGKIAKSSYPGATYHAYHAYHAHISSSHLRRESASRPASWQPRGGPIPRSSQLHRDSGTASPA